MEEPEARRHRRAEIGDEPSIELGHARRDPAIAAELQARSRACDVARDRLPRLAD
jgi:hypothetical protein